MYKDKEDLLNTFWNQESDTQLVKEFEYKAEENSFWGSIKLSASPKEDLLFTVFVPLSYPFSIGSMSIRFICEDVFGCKHVNEDGSICIYTPKNTDFKKKLADEVRLLKQWRDKYYISEEVDQHYEYPIISFSDNNSFLFTDIEHDFKRGEFGEFTAVLLANNSTANVNSELYYIQKIGSHFCNWCPEVLNHKSTVQGIYCFIEDEPLDSLKRNVKSWSELEKYFSPNFKETLYKIKTDSKSKNRLLHLLIGYRIPTTTEIHWQILHEESKKIPARGKKIIGNYYEYFLDDKPLHWSKTFNCSYSRFFGRGAINEEIANKKILIIGTGAVGSSLAKILVKSGAKNIALSDYDTLEPGNLCRSEFFTTQISTPKVIGLMNQLRLTSPFVNIKIEELVDKTLLEPFMAKEQGRLNQYDYIFDCTSDMELAFILDKLTLESLVFNISISNEAKELVCVVGNRTVSVEKAEIFKQLNTDENLLIYEGTGCWNPTFRASYFDIGILVNLAVKNINQHYNQRKSFNSFVIKSDNNNSSINFTTIDY